MTMIVYLLTDPRFFSCMQFESSEREILHNFYLLISDKNTWLGAEKEPRKKGDSDWLQVEAKKPPTPYHLARGAREPSGPNQEHPLKHPSGAFLRFGFILKHIKVHINLGF
jgi:hypothetical protein